MNTPKAVRAFIDFEFNSVNNEMLSVGVVTDTADNFYMVAMHDVDLLNDWVKENVVPHFIRKPIPLADVKRFFHDFLSKYSAVEFIYNAKADERYLKDLMSYEDSVLYTFKRDGKLSATSSDLPHMALHDAFALYREVTGGPNKVPGSNDAIAYHDVYPMIKEMGISFDLRVMELKVIGTMNVNDYKVEYFMELKARDNNYFPSEVPFKGRKTFIYTPSIEA